MNDEGRGGGGERGHHHCNVVVKDSGIDETLIWMEDVIDKNIEAGYLLPKAKDV